MTNAPNHRGSGQLVLWVCLLTLVGAAWSLDRYSRGYTGWTLVARLPWVSIALVGVAVMIFRSLVSRAAVTPEVAAALERTLRDRPVCRYCGTSLRAESLTCSACRRVVNWPSLVGAGLGVLLVVAWILHVALAR
jgi:hypothetical protein